MKKRKLNFKMKHFVMLLVWMFVVYMSIHLGHGIQMAQDAGHSGTEMLSVGFTIFAENTERRPFAPFATLFSFDNLTPVFFLFGNIIVMGVATFFIGKRNKFRYGEEHGSAVFARAGELSTIANKQDGTANILLTNEVSLSLDHRATRKNLNIIVIGGPGTGKTRYYVKPNLCQMSANYIVTDPKGEVLASCGKMLRAAGYKIKVLNLVDMAASDMYNPFVYLRKEREEDVLSLISAIIKNTSGSDRNNADPFWENAETLFLQAIFFYILYEEEPERQNMGTVMEMLAMADFTDQSNPLDEIFARLASKNPNHVAVTNYKLLKASAKETLRSIVIMANARFAPFSIDGVSRIFKQDTFALDELDNKKVAIFVIISPSNTTFNFIAAMFYTQYFAQLDYIANWVNPKKNLPQRLQIPALMILDEFANVGKIPNFEKILAYARSLNIGISIIVQSLLQLKEMYSEAWEGLWDSSDTKLFLGGQSQFTLEYISKQIGKETIDNRTRSRNFGRYRSSSQNEAILGRELMTPDEIALLPDDTCLLLVKSFRSFKGTKYDVQRHSNYRKLSEDGNFYVHNVYQSTARKEYCIRLSIADIVAEIALAEGIRAEGAASMHASQLLKQDFARAAFHQKQMSTLDSAGRKPPAEADGGNEDGNEDDTGTETTPAPIVTAKPPLMPEVGGFVSGS